MADPRYAHAFDGSRKGTCKRIVGHEICGLTEEAEVHKRCIAPMAYLLEALMPPCVCGHPYSHHFIDEPQLPLGSCRHGLNTDYPCLCREYKSSADTADK